MFKECVKAKNHSIHSNKTTNQMQISIVKSVALSYRYCSTCFGHYNAHHQELVMPEMMGIVMPDTCLAVSVRQSNKFYDWLLHLVGCFVRVIEDARNHKPLSHSTHFGRQIPRHFRHFFSNLFCSCPSPPPPVSAWFIYFFPPSTP
jgi:hypothetical protein